MADFPLVEHSNLSRFVKNENAAGSFMWAIATLHALFLPRKSTHDQLLASSRNPRSGSHLFDSLFIPKSASPFPGTLLFAILDVFILWGDSFQPQMLLCQLFSKILCLTCFGFSDVILYSLFLGLASFSSLFFLPVSSQNNCVSV